MRTRHQRAEIFGAKNDGGGASGDGTLLTRTESGFRESGWAAAVLDEHYRDHMRGWDSVLPNLAGTSPRCGNAP